MNTLAEHAVVDALRKRPTATVAEATGVSRKHARQTLTRLHEDGTVEDREGASDSERTSTARWAALTARRKLTLRPKPGAGAYGILSFTFRIAPASPARHRAGPSAMEVERNSTAATAEAQGEDFPG